MNSLKAKGIKAFLWDFFGKMATHGISFVVSIFLARLLDPSDFGLIAMIMVIIGMANVFTDVGLGAALIQRQRVRPVHYSSVFYFNVSVGLVLTLLTYFLAPSISSFYNNESLTPLIHVMSFSFLIGALSSVQNTRLRKELNYALLTKLGLTSSLLSGIIGISMAFLHFGVWSLVAQLLAMGIIYNLLLWKRSHWKPEWSFSWKALTQLWGFGFRMFLSGMLDTVFTRLDFLIIGKLFPPATLGYFQRAKSLDSMVVQYSSGSLMAILFPVLSKVQNDLPRFQNIIIKSLGIISFVIFLLLGMLYLNAREVIVILFSDKWLPSVHFFKLFLLSGFAYPVSALLVSVLSSRGNSKAFLRLEIYKKSFASLTFVVLYFFGIDAFLYAAVIHAFVAISLNISFASREIDLPFFKLLKPLWVQGGISMAVAFLLSRLLSSYTLTSPWLTLLEKASLFIIFYILVSRLFKTTSLAYTWEEIAPMIRKKFLIKV